MPAESPLAPKRSGHPEWLLWLKTIKSVKEAWDPKPDPTEDDEEKPLRGLAAVLINKKFPPAIVAEAMRVKMELPYGEAADPEDAAWDLTSRMWDFIFPASPMDPEVNYHLQDSPVVTAMYVGVSPEARLKFIARFDRRVRAAIWVDARDMSLYWSEDDGPVNALLATATYISLNRSKTGPTPVSPAHIQMLSAWIERVYGIPAKISAAEIPDAFSALLRRRHPIREMLGRLADRFAESEEVSDGRDSLLDTWLTRVFGAPDTPLIRAFGRKWLIQAVARVFEPGCTAKGVLSLVGMQDAGKSTALEYLAYQWSVTLPHDVGDKDSRLACHRGWIIELAELAGLRKASIEAIKTFLSEKVDTMRAPYARVSAAYPRSFVFAATTNDIEILKDATGNVRFWIVRVTKKVDFDDLIQIRDQLWAEAVHAYRAADPNTSAKPWYLTEDERSWQEAHNEDFEPEDEPAARLRALARRMVGVARRPLPDSGATHYTTTAELWRELQAELGTLPGASPTFPTTAFARQVAGALLTTKGESWTQVRTTIDGVKTRYYLPPASLLASIQESREQLQRSLERSRAENPELAALIDA